MNKCILFSILLLLSLSACSTEQMSAFKLIAKYRDNQDKLKSFISRSMQTSEFIEGLGEQEPETRRRVSELRIDGDKIDYRIYSWFNLSKEDEAKYKNTKFGKLLWDGKHVYDRKKGQFRSYLWDGKRHYEHRTGHTISDNSTFIRDNPKKVKAMLRAYGGSPLLGYLSTEDNRVDSILMQASSLSVRDELEEVGGFNCYVIDAATDYGPYTVWIDPQHGYNIARAENTKKPESLVRDGKRKLGGHGSYHFLLDNVRFEKIDGIWVPMEAYIEVKRYNANGHLRRTWEMSHKRIDFQLNPDHHALGSFIPQIEEGSRFPIEGVPGIQYEWRDGGLVTYIDEFIIDALDKSVDSLCSDVNANLTLNDKGKNEKTPDSAVLKVEKQLDEQDKDSAQDQVVATPGPGFSILFLLIGIGLAFLVVLFVVCFRRGKEIPHEKT